MNAPAFHRGLLGCALAAVALSAASVSSLAQEQIKLPAGVSVSGGFVYTERCATCHDPNSGVRAPSRETLGAMPVQQILAALEANGVMAVQGKDLSAAEKQAVASFLSASGAAGGQEPGLVRRVYGDARSRFDADVEWMGERSREHALPKRQERRAHRRGRAEADAEVGVRFREHDVCVGAAGHRRRDASSSATPTACSSRSI